MVFRIILYALALLSIVAGIPKIMQMPQELEFLSAIGLSGIAVPVLGLIQVTGGFLLFWPRTRLAGSVFAGLGLLVSSAALLVAGNLPFGLVSLLPFALLVVAMVAEHKRARQQPV